MLFLSFYSQAKVSNGNLMNFVIISNIWIRKWVRSYKYVKTIRIVLFYLTFLFGVILCMYFYLHSNEYISIYVYNVYNVESIQ